MKYEITMWEDGKRNEIHTFDLAFGDAGFYRAAVSIEYFAKREHTKLYNAHIAGKRDVPGKRAHVRRGEDIEHSTAAPSRLPKYAHATVWDFYKAVGYDYKRQKYGAIIETSSSSGDPG